MATPKPFTSSEPAENIQHATQGVPDADSHWETMTTSVAHDEHAFNAMLLDILGEAPGDSAETAGEVDEIDREEVFNDYLDTIPAPQRIVLVRHYGVFGQKSEPADTAAMLGISAAQYDEHLLGAKVALKNRKNELFKEITVDSR